MIGGREEGGRNEEELNEEENDRGLAFIPPPAPQREGSMDRFVSHSKSMQLHCPLTPPLGPFGHSPHSSPQSFASEEARDIIQHAQRKDGRPAGELPRRSWSGIGCGLQFCHPDEICGYGMVA